jgi:hypothetical protein
MNDDASTFELPDYIHSRLQPQIFIDFPERDEELAILKANVPFADEKILEYVVDFLQAAHIANERYSVRDGINIARYALKRFHKNLNETTHQNSIIGIIEYIKESASLILDPVAVGYFKKILEDFDEK